MADAHQPTTEEPDADAEALAFWMALFATPRSGLSGAGRRLFAKNDFEAIPHGFQWETALRMAHGFSFREVEAAATGDRVFNPEQKSFNESIVSLKNQLPRNFSEALALWPSAAIDATQASYRAMALNGLTLPAHSNHPVAADAQTCALLLKSASVWATLVQGPSNQIQKFAKRIQPWALELKTRAAQSDPLGPAKACVAWAHGLSGAARLAAARRIAPSGVHGILAFQGLVARCWAAAEGDFGALNAPFGRAREASAPTAGANDPKIARQSAIHDLRDEFVAALLPAAVRCVCPTTLLDGADWSKEQKKDLIENTARKQIIAQWGAMPDTEKNLALWVAEAEKTEESLRYNEQHSVRLAFCVAQAACESFIAKIETEGRNEPAREGGKEPRWDAFLSHLSEGFFNARNQASLSGAWSIHLAVIGAKNGLSAPVFFERAQSEWEPRMLASSDPQARRVAAIFRAARESIEIGFVARESSAGPNTPELENEATAKEPSLTVAGRTSRRL